MEKVPGRRFCSLATYGWVALDDFMQALNAASPLRFSHEASTETIAFLDVDVGLDATGFTTKVHVKPTNALMYLGYQSCHPPHTKNAIPRSLSIRGHRLCSEREDLEEYLERLTLRLGERGYPRNLLRRRIVPAWAQYQPPEQRTVRRGPFLVTTFFPGIQRLNTILRELYPILSNSPVTSGAFPEVPSVAYKRPRNLGDMLSHKSERTPREPSLGLQRCGDPTQRCQLCDLILPGEEFSSPNTPHTYKVQGTARCQSRMCVYELLCTECEAFYVGKATQLNLRINNHRSTTDRGEGQPVGRHAASHQLAFNDCFRVRVLKCLPEDDDIKLHFAEQARIWVLGALQPPGLNAHG